MTSDDSAKTSWSCANAQELALATPTSAISHELLHEVLPKVIHHQLVQEKAAEDNSIKRNGTSGGGQCHFSAVETES